MNLVNALNNPMGNYLELSGTEASFMQVSYYGAYFVMAIPASLISKKFGYKGGVITGLILFVIGSLIIVPATNLASYGIFLGALFVVAAGAATLETNCNPYITKLGDEKHESMRLNLAQSFNGLGNVVGPLILAQFLGQTVSAGEPDFAIAKQNFLGSMQGMYIVIAIAVAVILVVFILFKLPSPPGDEIAEKKSSNKSSGVKVFTKPYVALGVIAIFIFIGLQVTGMSLFSGFAQKEWAGLSAGDAAMYLSILSLLFTIGRFATTPLMAKFNPGKILAIYMTLSALLFFVAFLGLGQISVFALMAAYLFISIGYPTIFSLTITGLQGPDVKTVSSALVMAIVGAALLPLGMSAISDIAGINIPFLIAVPGFLFIA
ncbi:MAG: MFS transporter [Coriobacteriia bacterium]|nr:MFS transporter [Coriobacteriia bacterium]